MTKFAIKHLQTIPFNFKEQMQMAILLSNCLLPALHINTFNVFFYLSVTINTKFYIFRIPFFNKSKTNPRLLKFPIRVSSHHYEIMNRFYNPSVLIALINLLRLVLFHFPQSKSYQHKFQTNYLDRRISIQVKKKSRIDSIQRFLSMQRLFRCVG